MKKIYHLSEYTQRVHKNGAAAAYALWKVNDREWIKDIIAETIAENGYNDIEWMQYLIDDLAKAISDKIEGLND